MEKFNGIRFFATFSEKEYVINKCILELTEVPTKEYEGVTDNYWILKNWEYDVGGISFRLLNKIRTITATSKSISIECYCREEDEEKYLKLITDTIDGYFEKILNDFKETIKALEYNKSKGFKIQLRDF